MTRYLFTFYFLLGISLQMYAAEDADDFSLDDAHGNDASGASSQSSEAVLDDFGGGSNLFGNPVVGDPAVDNLSKKEASPALSSPDLPASTAKQEQSSGNKNLVIPKSANDITNPAGSLVAPTSNQSAPTPNPAMQSLNPTVEPTPTAPLQGDGSLAPVKQAVQQLTNEFGGVPPLPGTRRDMAPGEAPEVYSVEEGDTMFDVCSQLIDDGNYWPKLWSLNPDVRNPHFIYPGMRLAFYSGDSETPPYMEVVAEDEVVPVEKGEVKEAELVVEPEVIPNIGSEGASVVKAETPVLSEDSGAAIISTTEIGADADSLDGFIFAGKKYARDDLDFVVPAFFMEDEPESLGEVVSGPSGQSVAGEDKTILIEPEKDLGVGTYTILRPVGDVDSLRSGSFVGYRYDFAGNVRVKRKTKSGLLEGIVFDARTGIQSGDIVVNFIATKRNMASAASIGPVSTANSSIIGFQEAGKSLGGKGEFVFLEKEGLSVGGYYSIFRTDDNRDISHVRNDDVREDGGAIAVVRILEISGKAALGFVVAVTSEIKLGDSLSL